MTCAFVSSEPVYRLKCHGMIAVLSRCLVAQGVFVLLLVVVCFRLFVFVSC